MADLYTLQKQFQDYLMHDASDMLQHVAPDERFSAEKRLKIYFDAYRIRLLEILQLDFEKTHTLMGDVLFEQAFHEYLHLCPSEHFSVRYFGERFSHFLKTTSPYQEAPVLSEMATVEWLLNYTIDAKTCPSLKQDDLAHLSPQDWSTLRFRFHPSVISQSFAWDTPLLWRAIDKNEPPRAPQESPTPLRWIFWRNGLQSFFQSCNVYEDILFTGVEKNSTFSELCESLLPVLPEDDIPLTTAQIFTQWIQEGRLRA